MSYVSAVEIYKQTGTNPESHHLFPVTSNLEGPYLADFMVDLALAFFINTYLQAENSEGMNVVYESDHWVKVKDVYQYVNPKDVAGPEMIEFGLLKCSEYGYLEVTYYDDVRYFKLREKCLDLELYKTRKFI